MLCHMNLLLLFCKISKYLERKQAVSLTSLGLTSQQALAFYHSSSKFLFFLNLLSCEIAKISTSFSACTQKPFALTLKWILSFLSKILQRKEVPIRCQFIISFLWHLSLLNTVYINSSLSTSSSF